MDPQLKGALLGGLTSAAALTLSYMLYNLALKKDKVTEEVKASDKSIKSNAQTILLGDVGGTNVRLVLKRVYLHELDKAGEVIKDAVFHSQKVRSFDEALEQFLQVSCRNMIK